MWYGIVWGMTLRIRYFTVPLCTSPFPFALRNIDLIVLYNTYRILKVTQNNGLFLKPRQNKSRFLAPV